MIHSAIKTLVTCQKKNPKNTYLQLIFNLIFHCKDINTKMVDLVSAKDKNVFVKAAQFKAPTRRGSRNT
jgi:hypothetical protein